jgi:hypothetical protein
MAWANPAAPAAVPTPTPTVDPRDAQIAGLTAQAASLTQQLADAKAGQVVSLAQVAALQAQLATAQTSLAAVTARGAKYVGGLNTVITLGTAANAKKQGPTKADMSGVITAAKTALQ